MVQFLYSKIIYKVYSKLHCNAFLCGEQSETEVCRITPQDSCEGIGE